MTIDTDGVMVFERDAPPYRTIAARGPMLRPPAAGTTFVATTRLALAAVTTTPEASELASTAAAIVVGKPGTATCSADDLIAALSMGGKRVNDPSRARA